MGVSRDTDRQWISGVCAGVARRFGVDPLLIRAAVVVLAFVGGLGIAAYLLAWLFLPDPTGRILAQRPSGGDVVVVVLLGGLALLVLVGGALGDNPFGVLWWLLPVALIAWIVLRTRGNSGGPGNRPPSQVAGPGSSPDPTRADSPTRPYAGPPDPSAGSSGPRTMTGYGSGQQPPWATTPRQVPPPPPPPRPRRVRPSGYVGLLALGLAVVGFGAGYLLDGPLDFPGSATLLGLVLALGVLSVLTLALGLAGRAFGIAGVLTLLLLVPTGLAAAVSGYDGTGVGSDVTWTPRSADGPRDFRLWAGSAVLDLSALDADGGPERSADPTFYSASVDLGELTVVVPTGTAVRVDANVRIGSVHREDRTGRSTMVDTVEGGAAGERTVIRVGPDTPPTLVVAVNVGAGDILVKESAS